MNVAVLKTDKQTPVQLLKILKKYGYLDLDVLIGKQEKVPVRLVAQKVPEKIAAERRRKAKNNRDRRCKPNKESLMLLGWEIFITNVSREVWSLKNVCEIYGLRWRIEIIFKSWKSHFYMADVPAGNKAIVMSYIYTALILATLFQTVIYQNLSLNTNKMEAKHISLLKLTQFFKEQLWALALIFQKTTMLENIINQMVYHCVYEKRRNRIFYPEIISALS